MLSRGAVPNVALNMLNWLVTFVSHDQFLCRVACLCLSLFFFALLSLLHVQCTLLSLPPFASIWSKCMSQLWRSVVLVNQDFCAAKVSSVYTWQWFVWCEPKMLIYMQGRYVSSYLITTLCSLNVCEGFIWRKSRPSQIANNKYPQT